MARFFHSGFLLLAISSFCMVRMSQPSNSALQIVLIVIQSRKVGSLRVSIQNWNETRSSYSMFDKFLFYSSYSFFFALYLRITSPIFMNAFYSYCSSLNLLFYSMTSFSYSLFIFNSFGIFWCHFCGDSCICYLHISLTYMRE